MDIEAFREYCLSLPYVIEKMPFTGLRDSYSRDVLCFYIGSKWFCFVNIEIFDRCCLKSTPEEAEELRLQYEGIRPAWHMNKRMWNDVYFNQDVPDSRIKELVWQSYNLVYKSLTKKRKAIHRNIPIGRGMNCRFITREHLNCDILARF